MGFLKNLADSAINATRGSLELSFMESLGGSNPYIQEPYNEMYNVYGDDEKDFTNKPSSTINSYSRLFNKNKDQNESIFDEEWTNRNMGMEDPDNDKEPKRVKRKTDYATHKNNVIDTQYINSGFRLNIPTWGYDQFLQERSVWQKGLQNPFGEPGYFYFKIFFDFDTQYGLFGGVLNDLDIMNATNSAAKYLNLCKISNLYSTRQVADRLETLKRFVKTLSYINCNAPWFFNEIRGLDKAMIPTQKEFSKDKVIEIGCSPDAIDMRLTTLMDLYTYSCFDEINSCEIIPENLRKFNMMIMIFNTPIRHLHTPTSHPKESSLGKLINEDSGITKRNTSSSTSLGYKQITSGIYENWPTFKIFSLQNCEFSQDTLGSVIPSSMSNEGPFQLGRNSISIKYDKCLIYNMNEFNQFMFGSDGIYYDTYTTMNLQSRFEIDFHGKNISQDKYSPESFERYAHNNLSTVSSYGFGNLYGNQATKPNSAYWNAKVSWYKNKNKAIADFGAELLHKMLGSKFDKKDGWLQGYKDNAVGSEYWEEKLKKLKDGHPVFRTESGWITDNSMSVNSPYWNAKTQYLKDGNHLRGKDGWLSGTKDTAVGSPYWTLKMFLLKNKTRKFKHPQINPSIIKKL